MHCDDIVAFTRHNPVLCCLAQSKLMVSHVCNQKYRPNWLLIVWFAGFPLAMIAATIAAPFLPPQVIAAAETATAALTALPGFISAATPSPARTMSIVLQLIALYSYSVVAFSALMYFIITAIRELSEALNIWCFNITKPRSAKAE